MCISDNNMNRFMISVSIMVRYTGFFSLFGLVICFSSFAYRCSGSVTVKELCMIVTGRLRHCCICYSVHSDDCSIMKDPMLGIVGS